MSRSTATPVGEVRPKRVAIPRSCRRICSARIGDTVNFDTIDSQRRRLDLSALRSLLLRRRGLCSRNCGCKKVRFEPLRRNHAVL